MLSHLLSAEPPTPTPTPTPTATLTPTAAAAAALYLILEPVDMRLGIDGLSAMVARRLNVSPCAGSLYAFSNARRTRMKLLLWDATGVWLAHRRLHRGHFTWPKITTNTNTNTNNNSNAPAPITTTLSEPALQWLLMGVDWTRLSASTLDHNGWVVG